MSEVQSKDLFMTIQASAAAVVSYLLKRWYLLLIAAVLGAILGYIKFKSIKPRYNANISFVLSTEQKGGSAFAGLAAQLGFDAITSSPDNIFSGDNIIELFKSRKLLGSALLNEIDAKSHKTLLNLIAEREFPEKYKLVGPFGKNPKTYSAAQTQLYRRIITKVSASFLVFKKDKKLIIYILSASSTDPDIAYYTAQLVLNETSKYFIETKTKVAASSVQLLQHEADSLGRILSNTYTSTAAMIDRTYNLNPSISVQRSGSMFNQAKAAAYSAAFTEVMRNLEIAKINLQKETPLYRVIDEPELPLMAQRESFIKYIIIGTVVGLFLTLALLGGIALFQLYKGKKAKVETLISLES